MRKYIPLTVCKHIRNMETIPYLVTHNNEIHHLYNGKKHERKHENKAEHITILGSAEKATANQAPVFAGSGLPYNSNCTAVSTSLQVTI